MAFGSKTDASLSTWSEAVWFLAGDREDWEEDSAVEDIPNKRLPNPHLAAPEAPEPMAVVSEAVMAGVVVASEAATAVIEVEATVEEEGSDTKVAEVSVAGKEEDIKMVRRLRMRPVDRVVGAGTAPALPMATTTGGTAMVEAETNAVSLVAIANLSAAGIEDMTRETETGTETEIGTGTTGMAGAGETTTTVRENDTTTATGTTIQGQNDGTDRAVRPNIDASGLWEPPELQRPVFLHCHRQAFFPSSSPGLVGGYSSSMCSQLFWDWGPKSHNHRCTFILIYTMVRRYCNPSIPESGE